MDQLFWHFNKNKASLDRNNYPYSYVMVAATGPGSALTGLPVYAVGNACR